MLADLIKRAESPNFADELDDNLLTKIGRDVVELTQRDDGTRSEWLKKSERAMQLALQFAETKSFPWQNASNVKYPLITVAALQFHARAYPALVQGNNIVKCTVTGRDDHGQKSAMAKRVADYMNYQLLVEQEDWDEQSDKMLLALPIEGCEFKKTYYDPSLGHNVSEWVRPVDFIVDYKTKSLDTCPRMTHRLLFYPQEISERQGMGVWADVDLSISTQEQDDEELQEFYEQHTLLDLDETGYKAPYCVTVHVSSGKVVRIKAGYYPEDITIKTQGTIVRLGDVAKTPEEMQAASIALTDAKVVKIGRAQYFTKYSFIPSPDGGFYDIGFGQLIGQLTEAIDTNINQLIDAGTLGNTGAGFIREGVTVNNSRGPIKFTMGQYNQVRVPAGMSTADAVYQMKFPGPSSVLFNLLGMLIQAAKDITSVQDIFTGAQEQNETATTTMARVEQGMKVFTAIYKRIYRSAGQEFRKLYKLNSIYLQPETYFSVLDSQDEGVINLTDFRNDGTDVRPVSDPTVATTMQRMAKAQMLMQMKGDPSLNGDEITKRYLEALEVPNIDSMLIPPEARKPPPDVRMLEMELKAMRQKDELAKIQAEISLTYATAMERIANAEAKEVGSNLEQYRFELQALNDKFKVLNDQGRMAGMEEPPIDQGSAEGLEEIPGGIPKGGDGVGEPLGPGADPDADGVLQGEGGLP